MSLHHTNTHEELCRLLKLRHVNDFKHDAKTSTHHRTQQIQRVLTVLSELMVHPPAAQCRACTVQTETQADEQDAVVEHFVKAGAVG